MLNCFLFEKFYLHYALCDFDSIWLHYAKLLIRQSIDREKIFDVTFQNPPIEKSCVRHCLCCDDLIKILDLFNWIRIIAFILKNLRNSIKFLTVFLVL